MSAIILFRDPPILVDTLETTDDHDRVRPAPELDSAVTGAWDCDVTQFARLLCEMSALGIPDGIDDIDDLAKNMDLAREDVEDLFERAHRLWEAVKR